MNLILCCTFFVCFLNFAVTFNVLSPTVFVVTPSPSSSQGEGRSAPYYNHNWIRRIDSPLNATKTTTTTPKTKTPDLIFAEFESDRENNMQKSIRKLLEKERVEKIVISTTTSTTHQPVYFPLTETHKEKDRHIYTLPKEKEHSISESDTADYFSMYNNLYNKAPVPMYPSSTPKTTSTTTITPPPSKDIENIWHIINSEKRDQEAGNWEEITIDSQGLTESDGEKINYNSDVEEGPTTVKNTMNEDFSSTGLHANIGNDAENESRAIRTEPNIRFPYVSLKPYQMKKTINKKGNVFTSLDNFKELNNPVRGEAQDVVPMHPAIDRYNPAQPYLPPDSGRKPKPSGQPRTPTKAVANLVPPPPPPPPKVTGDDFPPPSSYESFPPYVPPIVSAPSPSFSKPAVPIYQAPRTPTVSASDDSQVDGGDTPPDMGYRYKPPTFLPTAPPVSKPFTGYSYKPPNTNDDDGPSTTNFGGYSYKKPPMTDDSPPEINMGGYSYNKPPENLPTSDGKPIFHSYHYDKPDTPEHPHHHDYGHSHPSYESDYPELIFDKPHSDMGDNKGGTNMKDSDMGMMPPPPPADMNSDMDSGPPVDDHGFPSDFPDFKFHHDFDDHDFFYHHHHHPTTTTTTTTTTESPRVNRFSYYYLGKKLYYLPLYFSVYFIVYVGALIIKAVLRHKIVYPNSWRPDGTSTTFFVKRSLDSWDFSNENLHEITGRITKTIGEAGEKYINSKLGN